MCGMILHFALFFLFLLHAVRYDSSLRTVRYDVVLLSFYMLRSIAACELVSLFFMCALRFDGGCCLFLALCEVLSLAQACQTVIVCTSLPDGGLSLSCVVRGTVPSTSMSDHYCLYTIRLLFLDDENSVFLSDVLFILVSYINYQTIRLLSKNSIGEKRRTYFYHLCDLSESG